MSAETVRNHYRRQGAEVERERIIKELENLLIRAVERFDDSDGYESHIGNRYAGVVMGVTDCLSLIKGEE